MQLELYPRQHRVTIAGTLALQNKTGAPVHDVYVVYPANAVVHTLRFTPAARLVDEAPALRWHHYAIEPPMAAGAVGALDFELEYAAHGFGNSGADPVVLDNGTFLNAGLTPETTLIPSLGYAEDGELSSDRERRDFGLAPKARMHDLNDLLARQQNALSRDADFIDYRAQFCTDADQLPLTSGYVERDWTEAARHCIAYRMDSKMADLYAFVSARFDVHKDVWHGPRGDDQPALDRRRQRGDQQATTPSISGRTSTRSCGSWSSPASRAPGVSPSRSPTPCRSTRPSGSPPRSTTPTRRTSTTRTS